MKTELLKALPLAKQMTIVDDKILFWNSIFSNFHPCQFELGGITWENSEQCFMYSKAMCFKDYAVAEQIKVTANPMLAKGLGRAVSGYNDSEWNVVRYSFMLDACLAKFHQNSNLGLFLIETGDRVLVEASPYDKIWGIGLGEDDPRAMDEFQWRGLNLLGKVLMDVRESLREV